MTNSNYNWLVLAFLLLAAATAGCANKKEDGSRVDVQYGGVSVRATETTGVIRGLVVDQSEEHTSELQSRLHPVCRPLLENKKTSKIVFICSDLWAPYLQGIRHKCSP